jgi:hypothetical protein
MRVDSRGELRHHGRTGGKQLELITKRRHSPDAKPYTRQTHTRASIHPIIRHLFVFISCCCSSQYYIFFSISMSRHGMEVSCYVSSIACVLDCANEWEKAAIETLAEMRNGRKNPASFLSVFTALMLCEVLRSLFRQSLLDLFATFSRVPSIQGFKFA